MSTRPRANEDVIERRRLEDASPRLLSLVPRLVAVRLELTESRSEGNFTSSHVKCIAVEHAPSVFMIACGEFRCKHGSFDLTGPILSALRRGETRIEASDRCLGDVGMGRCDRVLHCVAVAEYAAS